MDSKNVSLVNDEKSLFEIEINIQEQLESCSYWGELPITMGEYEYLCTALREKHREENNKKFLERLFKLYPACMVTTMVFFIVFEYTDEFWASWGKKLGLTLSQNYNSRIGNEMLHILKRLKKDKYEEDGYKFITPIICQAGVPDNQLDDIFYAIALSSRFDAHEILAEFKGWRAAYIKKPLERFIRLHEENALNLIVLVHDVMLDGNIESKENYEGRIYGQYLEWKENNLSRQGKFRGKDAYQESPQLILDDDKGLCIVLPEYILNDEYCNMINWVIYDKDNVIFDLECQVFNDGNSKHSIKKLVPVSAKEKYNVCIFDSDNLGQNKLLKEWEIKGLSDQQYLLFGNNGKRRTDEMFTYEGGTLIVCDNIDDINFKNVFETEIVMPNNEGIKTYSFIPGKSVATIEINNEQKTCLRLKKSICADLCKGTYLFADKESGLSAPIYTSEPSIQIEIEDGVIDQSISMVLRNHSTGFKKTVDIGNIEGLLKEEEFVSFKVLSAFNVGEKEYGRYSIKFYERGLYKKELEFAYIPDIIFDEELLSLWPNDKGTFLTSGFRYKKPKEIQLLFNSKVNKVTEMYNNEYWQLVKSNEPVEFIDGEIIIETDEGSDDLDSDNVIKIPFRKRIRNLQWMLWRENDADMELSYGEGKIDIRELESANWMVSISMKKLEEREKCFITLESSTGEILQEAVIRPSEKGKWHISMGAFKATIDEKKPPLTIRFRYESNMQTVTFRLLEIYESVILEGLEVKKLPLKNAEGEKIRTQSLIWAPVPNDYDMTNLVIKSLMDFDSDDIPIQNIRTGKLNGKAVNYMAFDKALPYGLYKLAYGEEDFFDFGYDEFEPPVLTYENTFIVDAKNMEFNGLDETVESLLDAVTAAYKSEKILERYVNCATKKKFKGELTINQLRRLMILAMYGLTEPNGDCEKYILEILRVIGSCLTADNKSSLLDIIISAEIKENEKKKLIEFFNLYYVVINETTQEKIDNIMSIDTFLGTRSVMKCERNKWVLNNIITSLGSDIIKEMMRKFPDGTIKVEATCEMFGDTDYFYNMFDWKDIFEYKNYQKPKLDTSKKPENELIFWGDGFINLMITWYFNGQGKYPEMEREIVASTKEIERMSASIIKNSEEDIKDYFIKTKIRNINNNGGFYPLIASSVKAGMIFALYDFGKIELSDVDLNSLMVFINGMNKVFPELIKRDILMAELFLYLKEV